jgi:hypothetical protein
VMGATSHRVQPDFDVSTFDVRTLHWFGVPASSFGQGCGPIVDLLLAVSVIVVELSPR